MSSFCSPLTREGERSIEAQLGRLSLKIERARKFKDFRAVKKLASQKEKLEKKLRARKAATTIKILSKKK